MKSFIIHNITAILADKLLPNARVLVRDGRIAEISGQARRPCAVQQNIACEAGVAG
jgi:hypothetical protein